MLYLWLLSLVFSLCVAKTYTYTWCTLWLTDLNDPHKQYDKWVTGRLTLGFPFRAWWCLAFASKIMGWRGEGHVCALYICIQNVMHYNFIDSFAVTLYCWQPDAKACWTQLGQKKNSLKSSILQKSKSYWSLLNWEFKSL